MSNKASVLRKFIKESGEDLDFVLKKYEYLYFIDKQNKKEIFSDVINGNSSSKTVEYLSKRLGDKKFNFIRDRRTPMEYGEDLILGWIAEDVCLEAFKKIGLHVSLQGVDKEREFLSPRDVKTNADLSVGLSENFGDFKRDIPQRRIEFIYDAGQFWKKYNSCHLRGDKFNKIKDEGAIIFGVSLVDKEAFYFDFRDISDEQHDELKQIVKIEKDGFALNIQDSLIRIKYIDKHFRFGNKSVYEICGVKNLLGNWKEKLIDIKNHLLEQITCHN